MSQAHTFLKTDFLVELDREARKEGYGVLVFNSSMDDYWAQSGNNATACVYSLIRYEKLAALVILAGDLYDTQTQEEIIYRANMAKVPVILQGGIHNACLSISCDYEDAYKKIIRHVVCDHGAADIEIRNADLSVSGDGNEVLLVGSRSGAAKIRAEKSRLKLSAACELLTGLGTANGPADVEILGCMVDAETRCDRGTAFGTFDGEAKMLFRDSAVHLYGEGYRVSGFGGLNGSCVTRVESGEVEAGIQAMEYMLLGNDRSRFIVTGGNINLVKGENKPPESPVGIPLVRIRPEQDHYEAVFRDGEEVWTYRADRNEKGYLGVWILP